MSGWKKVPMLVALLYNFIAIRVFAEEIVSLSSPGAQNQPTEFYALCSGAAILFIVALLWIVIFRPRNKEESA